MQQTRRLGTTWLPVAFTGCALLGLVAWMGNREAESRQQTDTQEGVVEEYSALALRQAFADSMQHTPPMALSPEVLQPGYTMAYYKRQLAAMGFRLDDVHYSPNRLVVDVTRNNLLYEVAFTLIPGESTVTDIHWQQYEAVEASPRQQVQTTRELSRQLAELPCGQHPLVYAPTLNRLGTVVRYDLQEGQAVYQLEDGADKYNIIMELDTNQPVVTRITLEPTLWQAVS